MKTIAFTSMEAFVVAGPTLNTQQAEFTFVVDKSDVIIKEITPVSSCLYASAGDAGQDLSFDFKTKARVLTTGVGKLFYSPVIGNSSPNMGLLIMNQVNKVDIRLFSGQSIGLFMPFHFWARYNAGDDFEVELEMGFIVSYEEVERKIFK